MTKTERIIFALFLNLLAILLELFLSFFLSSF